jgi:hypothetical protein
MELKLFLHFGVRYLYVKVLPIATDGRVANAAAPWFAARGRQQTQLMM